VKAYLDSSFLCSLYAADDHSATAIADVRRFRGELALSGLTELELMNALELRIFRKELTRVRADQVRAAFDGDVNARVLTVFDLEPATFLRARSLILQTTALVGCRTADILHVAAALEVGADRFFSFDQRQKSVARRVKLTTN
jgi:predicted nucleic acid-binding protein